MHVTRVAICVYTTNASQTLLSVEIAKAIVNNNRQKQQTRQSQEQNNHEPLHQTQNNAHSPVDFIIRFFTYRKCLPGSPPRTIDYEHLITEAGFDVQYFGSEDNNDISSSLEERECSLAVVDDDMWSAFLDAERNHLGFFPPPYEKRATPYIHAIMATLGDFQPDVVVYGLFPEVAVASAIRGWRTVSYVSVPTCIFRSWVQNHQRQETNVECSARNGITLESKPTNPWKVIQDAAADCGLELPPSTHIRGQDQKAAFFKAIQPNHTIVCDFESFYENAILPSHITVVGPIISSVTDDSNEVDNIKLFLEQRRSPSSSNDNVVAPVKVLLTMGSTGDPTSYLEGLKALCFAEVGSFISIVLIPSMVLHTCSEANVLLQIADSRDDILLVKKFINARLVTPLVDIVLCHGGQQTIQTALVAGAPIVGTPAHHEQQYNLENVERYQAGVCISPESWKEENIRKVLLKVGRESSVYRAGAARLQTQFLHCPGAERAGLIIMEMISSGKQKK